MDSDAFLGGVIEGFYGQPWRQAQRLELFRQMADWGLNTYFYAPKDDLKHRALWREGYDETELKGLTELVRACDDQGLGFVYGLGPGLDIRYSQRAERDAIKARFEQLCKIGCRHFALLFDDIPGALGREDRQQFASFAEAQSAVANDVFAWLRESYPQGRFLFCPTPYCGRMMRAELGGKGYLEELGKALHPDADVFWTGPEIVSREIAVDSIRELRAKIRRPPVIWDNLHANDYDVRRLFCGPYSGRSPALRREVRGILSNPNNEFPINYMAIRTLALYLAEGEDSAWSARDAYERALGEWHSRYHTVGGPLPLDDLRLLTDCYYLPHEEGPEAEQLMAGVERLLRCPPAEWEGVDQVFAKLNQRVQSAFERMTELKDRELFYAWSRRLWDLKEELQLVAILVDQKRRGAKAVEAFLSEWHLPGTYRGGMIARLQRLLVPGADGRFGLGLGNRLDRVEAD